jgi:excisionase family DNA binding protein
MAVKSPHEFLLTSSVAKILGVTPDTVRVWERLGRLPAIKTSNGTRLFDRRTVDQFARKRQAAA